MQARVSLFPAGFPDVLICWLNLKVYRFSSKTITDILHNDFVYPINAITAMESV